MARPQNNTLDAFQRANESPLSDSGKWDTVRFFVPSGGFNNALVLSHLAIPSNTTLATYGHTWNQFTSNDQEACLVSAGSDIVDTFTSDIVTKWVAATLTQCTRNAPSAYPTLGYMTGNTGATTSTAAIWSVAHSFANMYAEATMVAVPDTGNGCGPIICFNTSNTTGYLLYLVKGSPDTAQLQRIGAGGGLTLLGSANVTLTVGTRYRVRRSGNLVLAEQKPSGGSWTTLVSVTDTTYTTGSPGIRFRGTVARMNDFRLDDTNNVGTMVRCNPTGPTGGSGYIAIMYPGHIQCFRQDTSGSNRILTQLGSTWDVDAGRSVSTLEGDQVAVQVIGTKVRVWYKSSGGASGAPWVSVIGPITDATYTSGEIGMFLRGEGSVTIAGAAHSAIGTFFGRSLDSVGTSQRAQVVLA